MAWIMKNSAAMQIDRRDTAYLDDALKEELEHHLMPRYPTRLAASLPVLKAVQHKHGWIPHQALEEVAEFLGITSADLYDTATFYEEFFLQPKGKYVIWICQSISCELLGQAQLVERARHRLGVEIGETTDDGLFTLMNVECIGSCGTAPAAVLGETLHENLTPDKLDAAIDALREESTTEGAHAGTAGSAS